MATSFSTTEIRGGGELSARGPLRQVSLPTEMGGFPFQEDSLS